MERKNNGDEWSETFSSHKNLLKKAKEIGLKVCLTDLDTGEYIPVVFKAVVFETR